MKGHAGKYLGLGGWLLILSAVVGEYYAVIALQQPGGKINVKVLGILLNTIVLCIMIFMFVVGIL
jgi:hypothetical protein